MTISLVGVSTGTNTCSIPSHQAGDLILTYAYRGSSTTAPSLPASHQSILTKSGTGCSARLGFAIATSTTDTSGTWTNATQIDCHVYRSSNYGTGGSLYIGGSASSATTTLNVTYPALTMIHGDNTSWVAGFAASNNTTQTVNVAPSGMTNESSATFGTTSRIAGQDTEGTVSSWSAKVATNTGTAGDSVSATVEIIENQPATAVSNIVQHISYSYSTSAGGIAGDLLTYNFDPTLAGNGLVVAVAYASGATPTISDPGGDTFTSAGSAADAGAGNMALQIFICQTATTGTSQITVSFGGSPRNPVKVWVTQLSNITGTNNGYASASAVNASGILSPGSMTPTNNNSNGGNLILSYCCDSALASGTNPALFIPETGYALNDADISWTNGAGVNGVPNASQFYLQATSAATVPRFYLWGGGTDTYNVAAVALSVGTQGTPKPSGAGLAPHIDRICFFGTASNAATMPLQIPSTGNLGVFTSFLSSSTGTPKWTAVNDSDSVSWTATSGGGITFFYRPNLTASSSRLATVTFSGTGNAASIVYYDVSNADSSPFDTSASVAATGVNNVGSATGYPSITPSQANELTLCFFVMTTGPATTITNPASAVFDYPTPSIWKGIATISGTTMTVSSTAWGTLLTGAGTNGVISGSGVTEGTTPQSGTGPYIVQPSQTVSSATTMYETSTDGDPISYGNAAAHYYNGASLSAQSWNWYFANQPSNSAYAFAVIFKGPASSSNIIGGASASLFAPMLGPGPFGSTNLLRPSLSYPPAAVTVFLVTPTGSTLPMMGVG